MSILDFIHFPDDEKCYRTISFCDIETGDLYSDLMEIQILELKKLQKDIPESTGVNASNNATVYDWMRFFVGRAGRSSRTCRRRMSISARPVRN